MSRRKKAAAEAVPAAAIAEVIQAPVPLTARGVHDLAPEVVDQQVALYEAALRGDNDAFEAARRAL